MSKSNNWVSSVLAMFSNGDEAKLEKFHGNVIKDNNQQIKLRTDEIEENNDKMSDLAEESNEAILNVDLDRIKTTESRKGYVNTYKKEELMEANADLKEEIAEFEAVTDALNNVEAPASAE